MVRRYATPLVLSLTLAMLSGLAMVWIVSSSLPSDSPYIPWLAMGLLAVCLLWLGDLIAITTLRERVDTRVFALSWVVIGFAGLPVLTLICFATQLLYYSIGIGLLISIFLFMLWFSSAPDL